MWKAHTRSYQYSQCVERARHIIDIAIQKGNASISWSTGKDSTVLTHLVLQQKSDIPIIIQFDDCDWPEKREYAERVAKAQNWTYHSVMPDYSVWEAVQQCELGFEDICSQNHRITQLTFLKPLEDKQKQLNCNVTFLGLRKEESRSRKLNLLKRGELYQLRSGQWHCCPLSTWKTIDIFSYLIDNDIEINPYYLKNRFLPPEKIRLSWALPSKHGMKYGDCEHIRWYYPEQYRKLKDIGVIQ